MYIFGIPIHCATLMGLRWRLMAIACPLCMRTVYVFSYRQPLSPVGCLQCVKWWICDILGAGAHVGPVTLKFELGWDFCTTHLSTKFHHPVLNHLEVIVFTKKQTNNQIGSETSTLLCCVTAVEKYSLLILRSKELWGSVNDACGPTLPSVTLGLWGQLVVAG